MESDRKTRTVNVNTGSSAGAIWFIGWLFTIGFVKPIWWQAILAIVIWPYYLGLALAP